MSKSYVGDADADDDNDDIVVPVPPTTGLIMLPSPPTLLKRLHFFVVEVIVALPSMVRGSG